MLPAPRFTAFNPPRRILMGPGPSDVYPEVLAAQSRPTIGHLDPLFVGMMDELKSLIQYAFQTKNEMTMAVSAPGSAGMETCFVNLVEPGEKVIVCRNGVLVSVCAKTSSAWAPLQCWWTMSGAPLSTLLRLKRH